MSFYLVTMCQKAFVYLLSNLLFNCVICFRKQEYNIFQYVIQINSCSLPIKNKYLKKLFSVKKNFLIYYHQKTIIFLTSFFICVLGNVNKILISVNFKAFSMKNLQQNRNVFRKLSIKQNYTVIKVYLFDNMILFNFTELKF